MKLLSITLWYVVSQNVWLQVFPYPDNRRKCHVRETQLSDFNASYNSDYFTIPAVNDFKGHPFIVSTVKYSPFVNYIAAEDDGTLDPNRVTGMEFDVLRLFEKRLNFSLRATVPEDEAWGAEDENGTWTGIIGMVQRSEADIGASGLVAVPTSRKAIRYLSPWKMSACTLSLGNHSL